jgi:hypothetical protein
MLARGRHGNDWPLTTQAVYKPIEFINQPALQGDEQGSVPRQVLF